MLSRFLFVFPALLLPCLPAAVLIDATTGNGGFRSASSSVTGAPSEWTAERGTWIGTGNSPLTTPPFGADDAVDSRYLSIHNDAGETVTSSSIFSVETGDILALSLDWKVGGSGNETQLEIVLWDATTGENVATLGVLNTEEGTSEFVQQDFTYAVPQARSQLRLRLLLSSAGGLGRDVHVDRVHLSGGTLVDPEEPVSPSVIEYAYRHDLNSVDSEDVRIEKAAKVLPKPKQVEWQRLENTFFIHFGPNTFSGREWGTGFESPSIFNPSELDATQWVDVIQQAGGKMLMLVVKHHEGFCLYPSRYTTHDVASSPWKNGEGDLVREVADACAAAGIKLGVYLSPADLYQIESSFSYANGSGYYGNGSVPRTSTIPTDPATFGSDPTQGRSPPEGFGTYTVEADDYNRYFYNQLYELLTEYGEIAEVWFDGANPKPGTSQTYDYPGWYEMIYDLQPNTCIAIGGPDVRWVGNETGYARETEWSVVAKPVADLTYPSDLGSRDKLVAGKTLEWWPAEADTKVLSGWFWRASNSVKSTTDLINIYHASVGRNANLLLNLSPDTRGLVPDNQITPVLEAFGVVNQTYQNNVAAGGSLAADSVATGQEPSLALDGDLDTWWEPEAGQSTAELVLTLPEVRSVDRIVLQEAIAQRSQRIESFAVDTWDGVNWVQQATGTTVGHKRISLFPAAVETDQVRIRILQSRLEPSLAQVSLHRAAALVSTPVIANRNPEGKVTLSAATGLQIRYTLDGSDPTPESTLYTGPFDLPLGGTVRAIAVEDISSSFIVGKEFAGVTPAGWTVVAVDSEEAPGEAAILAIDDDPTTLWHTGYTEPSGPHPHAITVDMKSARWLGGFTYLPRPGGGNGTVVGYRFEVSEDNETWTPMAEGTFGNIQNNPVRQKVFFEEDVKARYFRFTALSEINGADFASAAEINVLPGGFDAFRQEQGLQTVPADADEEGDGRDLLLEYYQGTDPGQSDGWPLVLRSQPGELTLDVVRAEGVIDVTPLVQYTLNLMTPGWLTATILGVQTTALEQGWVQDRYTLEPPAAEQAIFRVQLER